MIESHIRKISVRRMLLPFLCIIIVGLLFAFLPFSQIFHPTKLEEISAITLQYEQHEYYVNVTCDELHYTGYDYYLNDDKLGAYYYTFVDNTCYLVLLEIDDLTFFGNPRGNNRWLEPVLTGFAATGKLRKISEIPDELFASLATDLNWTTDGVLESCNTYYLDECSYDLDFYQHLRIIFCVLLGIFAFWIIILLVWIMHPHAYWGCLKLLRYGTIREQIARANSELSSDVSAQFGIATLTPNYYLVFGKYQFQIMPRRHIVWAYKLATMQKLLFFRLPIRYELHVLGRGSVLLESEQMSADDSTRILRYLKETQPDVIVGYTDTNRRHAWSLSLGRRKMKKNNSK